MRKEDLVDLLTGPDKYQPFLSHGRIVEVTLFRDWITLWLHDDPIDRVPLGAAFTVDEWENVLIQHAEELERQRQLARRSRCGQRIR